jgi:hypothetical protein
MFTPFISACFHAEDVARGSKSAAMTRAPACLTAAMPRMPVPQPRSRVRGAAGKRRSDRSQRLQAQLRGLVGAGAERAARIHAQGNGGAAVGAGPFVDPLGHDPERGDVEGHERLLEPLHPVGVGNCDPRRGGVELFGQRAHVLGPGLGISEETHQPHLTWAPFFDGDSRTVLGPGAPGSFVFLILGNGQNPGVNSGLGRGGIVHGGGPH